MRKIISLICLIFLLSCNDSVRTDDLKYSSDSTVDSTLTEPAPISAAIDETALLKERQDSLMQIIQEQEERQRLHDLAETTPIEISNYRIYNGTNNSTELDNSQSNSNLFDRNAIRYIIIDIDFSNNLASLDKTLYGKLYVCYIDPYNNIMGDDNYFTTITGEYKKYTMDKDIASSSHYISYSRGWGNTNGGAYPTAGKYKIEIWFDRENDRKARLLKTVYFEIF